MSLDAGNLRGNRLFVSERLRSMVADVETSQRQRPSKVRETVAVVADGVELCQTSANRPTR